MVHPRQKKENDSRSRRVKKSKNEQKRKQKLSQSTNENWHSRCRGVAKKKAFSQQRRARKIAKVLKTNVPVTILKDEKWRNALKRFSLEGCQKKKKRAKTAILTAEVSKKKKSHSRIGRVAEKKQKWLKPMVPLRLFSKSLRGEKKG